MPSVQFDWEGLVQTMSGCTSASSTFLSCAWTTSCPAPALLEGLIPCTYGKCSKWFHSTCCPGANPEFAESSLAEIKSCFQCPECFEEAKKVIMLCHEQYSQSNLPLIAVPYCFRSSPACARDSFWGCQTSRAVTLPSPVP